MKLSTLKPMIEPYGRRTATRPAAGVERTADSPQAKRLQEMKEGLEKLNSMPSPKEMAKQAATARVAMLKQRLDGMKKLLAFATPQMAKALARELKEMARELAAAARELGGGADAAALTATPAGGEEQAAAQSASAAAQQAAGEDGQASAAAREAAQATASAHAEPHDKARAEDAPPNAQDKDGPVTGRERTATAAASSDSSLRDLIIEVRKKLKDALALVKMQLEKADREGRRDAAEAERALRKVDQALREGDGLQPGAGVQGFAADAVTGAAVSIPSVGTFINVSA